MQLPCLGDEAHPEGLQGQDVHSSGISQPERLKLLAEEDRTVPSVMKLIEKLTDEEVEELIPDIDVDDKKYSEQIVDVPVPQIAERIVEEFTAFHGSESQSESLHRSAYRRDLEKVFEKLKDGKGVFSGTGMPDMSDSACLAIKTKTETQKSEPTTDAKSVEPSQKDVDTLLVTVRFSLDEETIQQICSNPNPEIAFDVMVKRRRAEV